jgi:hypothetical protein
MGNKSQRRPIEKTLEAKHLLISRVKAILIIFSQN